MQYMLFYYIYVFNFMPQDFLHPLVISLYRIYSPYSWWVDIKAPMIGLANQT